MRIAGPSSLLVLTLLVAPRVCGQSSSGDNPPKADRTYRLLREDEDWSFLADPAERQDFWDPIKYIRLRSNTNDWFLTIGGEAREVWEQIGNDNWGQQPYMNGYLKPALFMKAQESDASGPILRIGALFRAWRTCRAAAGNAFAVSKTVNRPVSDRLVPWPENVW